MTVNGKPVSADVDPRTLLVQFLRETLRLTGTHGADVVTIEGLATDGKLHPMQEAFRENHGLQCGFCTPGMIMSAVDIVRRKGSDLDEKTIRHELEGNICRCTGYHNIVKAIAAGAAAMAPAAE
jgi:carbon-monoxide dehydrogenase small subunit